jgi:hypothetical protein
MPPASVICTAPQGYCTPSNRLSSFSAVNPYLHQHSALPPSVTPVIVHNLIAYRSVLAAVAFSGTALSNLDIAFVDPCTNFRSTG